MTILVVWLPMDGIFYPHMSYQPKQHNLRPVISQNNENSFWFNFWINIYLHLLVISRPGMLFIIISPDSYLALVACCVWTKSYAFPLIIMQAQTSSQPTWLQMGINEIKRIHGCQITSTERLLLLTRH